MKAYFALFVAALLSLSACTKSSFGSGSDIDDPHGSGGGGGSVQGNNKGVYIAQITYPGDTVKFVWRNDKLRSIERKWYSYTTLCKIQYNDSVISSVSVEGRDTALYNFYYAGNILLKIAKQGDNGYTLDFDYDANGNPRKIGIVNLDWSEHNIDSCQFEGETSNGRDVWIQNHNYRYRNYDDKPSVFSGMKLEARMAYLLCKAYNFSTTLDGSQTYYIRDDITYLSSNNPGDGYLYQNDRPIKNSSGVFYKYTDGTGFAGEQ